MGRCGSEDSKSRRTSKLNDWFKSYVDFNNVFLSMINLGLFWIWNQFTVDNRGVSRGRYVVVGVSALVTGGR